VNQPTRLAAVKAHRSFFVAPQIPESLRGLTRLAENLHWSWDAQAQHLFERLDPAAWERSSGNPVECLQMIDANRWADLAADARVIAEVHACVRSLDEALEHPGWFQERTSSPLELVAYFSPEFGLTETLPQYSGGLGVLAGDHLKAASDLGLPLVAIGLLYRQGYFRQQLDQDGWQRERFPQLDTRTLAITDTGVRVAVDLAGTHTQVAVWRVNVGRIHLYLLDTDVEGNTPETRTVTDRLYGGDVEHRLRQEIVLGIGGVRALRALGLAPQVFHTNEGHAGFLALERIREHVTTGASLAAAVQLTRAGGLFTTHTPVPAGIDRYERDLMAKYFTALAAELGCTLDDLLALGSDGDTADGSRFNMAAFGLRMSGRSNAVAALHGQVSRSMFAHLWPGALPHEVPITSITNGVHAKTWVSPHIDALLSGAVHPVWDGADRATWARIRNADPHAIWSARREGRSRLVGFVRERLHAHVLDEDVLTIGFARRFATYKRATLLLNQPDRLRRLLLSTDRPVQFVFAGKAHPADEPGKSMIQAIEHFARELEVSHRFVFVPDYDMGVARAMYHGCDVWLNTPRRPLEACGTSGMKAALNGALNCSIADGWWDECADGLNGWTIASADDDPDPARRDLRESLNLFAILEGDVVPTFYDGDPPLRWIARMKHAWATLGPFVTAARMVKDYTTDLYEPAAAQARHIDLALATELAQWRAHTAAVWPQVRITAADVEHGKASATVEWADLHVDDLVCELAHGRVDTAGNLVAPTVEQLSLVHAAHGRAEFACTFSPSSAGSYGASIRVRAHHRALANPVDSGLITWSN